jgi:hypothetical protein
MGLRGRDARLDVPGGRILLDRVEHRDVQPGIAQRCNRSLGMAGVLEARVGD